VQKDGTEPLKTETRKQTGQQFGFCIYTGEQTGLWAVGCSLVLKGTQMCKSLLHTLLDLKNFNSTKCYTRHRTGTCVWGGPTSVQQT
jgi:hypothetical protein